MHGRAPAPGHRLRREQGVDDRFLGRFDRGVEEPVHRLVRQEANRLRRQSIPDREGEHEVAARVFAGPASAGDPERRALRKPCALMREERSIRGDDDDDRAGDRRRGIPTGAELTPDGDAVDRQPGAASVVRLHEHGDGVAVGRTP
jgi:hypothetical protein